MEETAERGAERRAQKEMDGAERIDEQGLQEKRAANIGGLLEQTDDPGKME